MTTVQLSRKNLLAIFVGFLIIVLIGAIISTIFLYLNLSLARTVSLQDFKSVYSQQPYVTVHWVLRIVTYLSPLLGGYVVGKMVKEKGWLYGGLLGIMLLIFSVGIVSITFILPPSQLATTYLSPQQAIGLAQKNILNQLINAPLFIVTTGLGGYLGGFTSKKSRKKK